MWFYRAKVNRILLIVIAKILGKIFSSLVAVINTIKVFLLEGLQVVDLHLALLLPLRICILLIQCAASHYIVIQEKGKQSFTVDKSDNSHWCNQYPLVAVVSNSSEALNRVMGKTALDSSCHIHTWLCLYSTIQHTELLAGVMSGHKYVVVNAGSEKEKEKQLQQQ